MALLQNDEESPKVTLWSDPISRSGETFMMSLSPFCCVELETSFETLFETFSVLSTCSLVGVVLRILILDSHLFVGVMDAVAFVLVDRVGRFVIVDFEIVSVFDCCFFLSWSLWTSQKGMAYVYSSERGERGEFLEPELQLL